MAAGGDAYVIKPEIKQLVAKTTELLTPAYRYRKQKPISSRSHFMPTTSQFLKKTATV
jgi:hypothetical protein